ncbi:MAG: hypothetical protein ACLPSW_22280 [Roseiarcus sp.]
MGGFSIFHWIVFIVVAAVYFIPVVKILNRAGYSGWWSLLGFFPIVNVIALWVFAYAQWPALDGAARRS